MAGTVIGTLSTSATFPIPLNFPNGTTLTLGSSGTPEGVTTAPIGSLYTRSNGSTGTTLYIKESGVGNTGWVAVSVGGGGLSGITNSTPGILSWNAGSGAITQLSGPSDQDFIIASPNNGAGVSKTTRIKSGTGTTGTGDIVIQTGAASNGTSGGIAIFGSDGTGAAGAGGGLQVNLGAATGGALPGSCSITCGSAGVGNDGGHFYFQAGNGGTGAGRDGGYVSLDGGNAGTGSGGKGGYAEIYGGVGDGAGQGGDLTFYSGNGGSSGNSGVFECAIGTPGTGASAGNFLFSGRSGDVNNTEVHFRTNGTDYLIFYDNGTIHFPVDSSGNIEASDAVAASTNPGGSLIFSAGNGDGTGIGGDIAINGGYGGETAVGGNITLTAGHGGSGSGTGGNITVLGGFGLASGESGGAVYCTGGAANSTSGGFGGEIVVSSGSGGTTGIGGAATLVAGNGGSTSGDAGNAYLRGGAVTDGNGGRVYIEGTSGAGGFGNGGFIECKLGAASGGSDSYFNVVNTGGTQLLKVLYTGGLHAFYTVTPITDTGVTLTNDDTRTLTTNEGAAALTDRTLPSAVAGTTFTFYCQDADGIKVIANTGDTIRLSAGVSATAGYVKSTVVGSLVTLVAINATEWVRISEFGTWTIDS